MSTPDQKEDGHAYGRDEVVKIINSVIAKVEHTGDVSKETIFKELKDLQAIIDDARKEIGLASPGDINDKHIPTATDELDAVVEATAEATGTIMDACEAIQENTGAIGGDKAQAIEAEVMKIFEACSFQDITGQRITKTVNTLKQIEVKVGKLLAVLGDRMPGLEDQVEEEDSGEAEGDAALLNGPQMADKAISQDDIDKLLAEFD